MDPVNLIFVITILIFSIVIHEVSHGYVANMLGDPTARLAGRLTLNPLRHLDLWGSVIIPLLLIVTKAGFIIGWAKPVPYNPYNMKDPRVGGALVAGAGPGVNIIIAIVFGALVQLSPVLALPLSFAQVATLIVFINILLAVFNLIPVPPLDGSKVLAALLPYRWSRVFDQAQEFMARYGIFALLLFVFVFFFFLWPIFFRLIFFVSSLLTGFSAVELLQVLTTFF